MSHKLEDSNLNSRSSRQSGIASHRDRDRSRSRSRSRSPRNRDNPAFEDKPKSIIQIIGKNRVKSSLGIQMKLGAQKPVVKPLSKPKLTIASAFNEDSDEDEPEEMPPEAKMRMRNIGRDTPTSSGPNSFGKTKHGFSDSKKVFEKTLKEALDNDTAK